MSNLLISQLVTFGESPLDACIHVGALESVCCVICCLQINNVVAIVFDSLYIGSLLKLDFLIITLILNWVHCV